MMTSLHLILAIISLSSALALSEEWLDCGPSNSFVVELETDERAFVYDADIKVKYDRNELSVYEYAGLDAVNILMNNTVVTFNGYIVPENEELNTQTLKTTRVFNSSIAGTARLSQSNSQESTLTDCNLYLSRNRNDKELIIPKRVQVEILHEAVSCIKATLCRRLGAVTVDDMKKAKSHPFKFGLLSVFSAGTKKADSKPIIDANSVKSLIAAYENLESNSVEKGEFQKTINKIVDVAVEKLVEIIRKENQGIIKIPNLSQNFSTGSSWWETTGEFNSYDGTFNDLTTLRRVEDAVLSRSGLKLSASCGFGLSIANMNYQNYKLRYGIINVDGEVWANIDGVAVSVAVSIDYNQKPCRLELQELRISEIGKMKVKVTGLAPLNKLLSKLVTWITKKWQDDIVKLIEDKLKELADENLNKFNCEKYRPYV